MLLKSKITKVPMYSGENYFDGWLIARLGKFTASKISCCMMPKGIGDTGMAYIRSRVFETLNGISSEKEVDTDAMRWGLKYEPDALRAFIKAKEVPVDEQGRTPVISQKLVYDEGSLFSCTPDGIWIQQEFEKEDGVWLKVAVQEVKCYQLARHLKCVACDTVEKILAVDPDAAWQLIMQMDECSALDGYLVYFYPGIKYGGLRIIHFRRIDMVQNIKIGGDNIFKFFNKRKQDIISLYEREKELLLNINN